MMLATGEEAPATSAGLTVRELVERWQREDGPRLTELERCRIRLSVRPLLELFAALPAAEFGPKRLMEVRKEFVKSGFVITTCNDRTSVIRRCWRWAVAHELVPADSWHALLAVRGLKPRETTAPPPRVRLPARRQDVEAVVAVCARETADLIRLQRATATRSGEILSIRGDEIDRSDAPWIYWPGKHKCLSLGQARQIPLGPIARGILLPRLEQFGEGLLFPGPKQRRISSTLWYDRVKSACRLARRLGLISGGFTPHQLRHAAACEIRKLFGLDAAQAFLGHRSPQTTERYAGKAWEKALEAAEELG